MNDLENNNQIGNDKVKLSANLKRLATRKEGGVSQRELAKIGGVSPTYIHQLCHSDEFTLPKPIMAIIKIARYHEMTLDELFYNSDSKMNDNEDKPQTIPLGPIEHLAEQLIERISEKIVAKLTAQENRALETTLSGE